MQSWVSFTRLRQHRKLEGSFDITMTRQLPCYCGGGKVDTYGTLIGVFILAQCFISINKTWAQTETEQTLKCRIIQCSVDVRFYMIT